MSSHESPGTSGTTPEQAPAERRGVVVRRAPRYVPFLIAGALAGIAGAAFIAFGIPGNEQYDSGTVFGFFMVLCAVGGAALGAIAALVLDRRSVRNARRAVVEAVPGPEGGNTASHGGGAGNPAGS